MTILGDIEVRRVAAVFRSDRSPAVFDFVRAHLEALLDYSLEPLAGGHRKIDQDLLYILADLPAGAADAFRAALEQVLAGETFSEVELARFARNNPKLFKRFSV